MAIGAPVFLDRASDEPVSAATDPVAGVAVPPAQEAAAATQTPPPPFDRSAHSTTDPSSIWVVVNKTHPIAAEDFRPDIDIVRGYQVATPAAGPLGGSSTPATAAVSGSRSPARSARTATSSTCTPRPPPPAGRRRPTCVSARAGYSEHQTGLAVDLITPDDPGCDFDACFARTPGGRWLARNAWRFGFVVRYQAATTAITGYAPEPWHLRYVGKPLAAELHRTGVATLEEFFGITGGDYPE